MKRLAPITALFAVTSALAHPGHGAPEVHFHVEWLLAIAAAALLWRAWKK
ncbi:MAG TPA: hypothetical protein VLF42_04630 [Burkholderiales bacterium]|nr:hypothetical protein [Burkholderiales bacterium]